MARHSTEGRARRLYVRVDATRESGLGHLMRCVALAEAWQDEFGPVSFIGRHDRSVVDRLRRERIGRIALSTDLSLVDDIAASIAAIPSGSPIVLDGYGFDPDYQRALDAHGRLLVIDDLGQWPAYAGRLLVNQNLYGPDVPYGEAPPKRLLGPAYVMLDRSFADVPRRTVATGAARRWLVTLGGADSDNVTAKLAVALASAGGEACTIRLLVGPLNPHRAQLEPIASQRANLELLLAPESVRDALAWADLAVSAAGTTSLQLARLGVPMLLIAIADNQVPVGQSLDRAGAAVYLGRWPAVTAIAVARAARELSADASRRKSLGDNARILIDGSGAARVCRALAAEE
jgi:UDP-2,4-diacetamido-2,4,6-trideoxy-beta-L-altropyranose hydrolase